MLAYKKSRVQFRTDDVQFPDEYPFVGINSIGIEQDFALQVTLAFVRPSSHVIEVGCGRRSVVLLLKVIS